MTAFIASATAIALPNPNPTPGFWSWYLNRIENNGFKYADQQLASAAKKFAKVETAVAQDKSGLGTVWNGARGTQKLKNGVEKLQEVTKLHESRQGLMDIKIEMAATAGNQAKAKALTDRKIRKASEMTAKIETLGRNHEGLFSKLENRGNRLA